MEEQTEFNKAVKNKIWGNFAKTIACGFLTFMFLLVGSIFCTVETASQDVYLSFFMFGIFALVGLIYNFINLLEFSFSKKLSENYHLCKRCKKLVDKKKVFCNDCKHSLRRIVRDEEDKIHLKEYKKIMKKEKKK